MNGFSISMLARAARIAADTVRRYERLGSIVRRSSGQTAAGRYAHSYLLQVRMIRRAKAVGFSLAEITTLLHIQRAGVPETCTLLRRRLDRIEQQVEELQRWRVALLELMVFGSQGMPALQFLRRQLPDSEVTSVDDATAARH
jgi:MerR family mercuric resistance operon transcriptional regulator